MLRTLRIAAFGLLAAFALGSVSRAAVPGASVGFPSLGTASTPAFSPVAGSYGTAQSVTITTTPAGAQIYCTTNGSTPTNASPLCTNPQSVGSSLTLKALAITPAWHNSAVGSAAYTISGGSSQPVPAYGAYLIGGSGFRYDNSTYQAYASLMYVDVMAWSPGWDSSATQSMNTIMGNINALSTIGTKHFLYQDPWYIGNTLSSYQTAMTTNNWVLRTLFPAGSIVANPEGPNQPNLVTGGPTDGSSRTYQDYNVQYNLDYMMNGGAAGLVAGTTNVTNPLVSGIYLDDLQEFATPSGDWLRNGTTGATVDAAVRSGFIQIESKFKALKPALLMGGNLAGIAESGTTITEYIGTQDFGVLENMIGTNSFEIFGASTAIAAYQKGMTAIKSGGIGIFVHSEVRTDGSDPLTATGGTVNTWSPAYQGVRHGWALCNVMGNAVYFANLSYDPSTLIWFDWFSVNTTTGAAYSYANAALGTNWLGAWVDGPQTTAFQNGMYRRRATNGEVWWNPRGNGAQTISFGRSVRLINSAVDPKQNGATGVTTLSMADRDGIAVLYYHQMSEFTIWKRHTRWGQSQQAANDDYFKQLLTGTM